MQDGFLSRFLRHTPLPALLLLSILTLASCDGDGTLGPQFSDDASAAPGSTSSGASGGPGHEPAGYAAVTNRLFTDLGDAGWGYNESSHFSIVEDASTPGGCCTAAEVRFPRGWKGGTSPMVSWHDGPQSEEIYISFHLKLSENWQGHDSGVNKLGFVWIHDNAAVYFSAQGTGDGTIRPRIRLQDVPDGARNLEPNVSDAVVERGQWHRWEIQLVSNTPGSPDGIARIWLDGVLVSDHTDVRYSGASQANVWQHVFWYPVWGGMDDAVHDDMSLRISDYYASGR